MKLKYYLRGLGIGIIITTIILMIGFSQKGNSLSDKEIMARATQLGMIMPEEEPLFTGTEATETETPDTKTPDAEQQDAQGEGDIPPDTGGTLPEGEDAAADGNVTEPQNPEDLESNIPPAGVDGTYRLTIQRGDVCRTVCETLAANGVVNDAEELRKYLFEIGYASSMSIGNYDIPYGLTLEEIAQILQAGPLERQEGGVQ